MRGMAVTHVVALVLTDPADREECVQRVLAMDGRIESMRSITAGSPLPGTDPERLADVCLIAEFDDLAGVEAYLVSPAHQEFGAWVGPRIASRTAIDFTPGT